MNLRNVLSFVGISVFPKNYSLMEFNVSLQIFPLNVLSEHIPQVGFVFVRTFLFIWNLRFLN